MSQYKYHVFFCTNERTDGRECCQDHDAREKRAYLKNRCKELKLRAHMPERQARLDTTVMLTVQTMNFLHGGRHRVAL